MGNEKSEEKQPHLSVLYHETILALQPKSGGRYIDATLGAGGHAWGILEQSSPDGQLLGLDVDPQALNLAAEKLSIYSSRAVIVQSSYLDMKDQMTDLGWPAVDGIVFDLGVSSMQLDTPERGFSFMSDGLLDMRFDPRLGTTAADLVNQLPEEELARIIWLYGEENQSRRFARAIVSTRPLRTTSDLANTILKASGGKRGRVHPATKTFQALRIAVNEELSAIEKALPVAVEALNPGGRLAIISFHSLEDRLVKQFFRRESKDCICPPDQPFCTCNHKAIIREITRHPIVAAEQEISGNPRARSARLRIAEKG
ncbi:MAG: 16S rRNA (cytosine(1402)-N(4))-methyltransferase RsmH [Anaerolineaceae bacterium]